MNFGVFAGSLSPIEARVRRGGGSHIPTDAPISGRLFKTGNFRFSCAGPDRFGIYRTTGTVSQLLHLIAIPGRAICCLSSRNPL